MRELSETGSGRFATGGHRRRIGKATGRQITITENMDMCNNITWGGEHYTSGGWTKRHLIKVHFFGVGGLNIYERYTRAHLGVWWSQDRTGETSERDSQLSVKYLDVIFGWECEKSR